ncbi:hypothetical protein LCGC14_0259410 [marine sediment metagenome]|uniref:Uncharacterized protein n=1 Tax=marine sediment metagenome TaxID=412755 RepID=A0A0F9WMY3_9ZZZZ
MPAPRLDQATIERMLLAYIKDPNTTYVAKACNVSWETAKKYIQHGAPTLGIGPFATEARRILRNGDKIVRLTEVTKEIRYKVEERDLAGLQDMLFEFEATIHECIGLVKARATREKEYFAKCDDMRANETPEDMIAKVKVPRAMNMNDLRGLAQALHELDGMKRQFWDRLEIVRRTTVESTVSAGDGPVAEGIAVASPPPLDLSAWQPYEIAAYVDSIDEGLDPVYPAWMTVVGPGVQLERVHNGANVIPDKKGLDNSGQDRSVMFPPAADDPKSDEGD